MENKILALAQHLSIDPSDINYYVFNHHETYDADGGEYLVLTNEEADELWNEYLENYIDECILPEIPETYRNYFDSPAWKRDAQYDGRGHSLATYDGEENEIKIDGTWYYIYRIN